MSYDTNLAAAAQEATPEFYRFSSGSDVQRYTSYPTDLTFLDGYYSAASITRSAFTKSVRVGSDKTTVVAGVSDYFKKLIAAAPLQPITIQIYRALFSDLDDYRMIFDGVVRDIAFEKNAVSFECESQATILQRKIPKYIYQAWCNHELFDAGCGLISSGWRITATVVAIDGATLSLGECATYEDDHFTGGYVEFENDMRLITSHVGSDVDLHMAFGSSLAVGASVYVYPGCDGDPETCDIKFENLSKFTGFPYIPSSNPAVWGFR